MLGSDKMKTLVGIILIVLFVVSCDKTDIKDFTNKFTENTRLFVAKDEKLDSVVRINKNERWLSWYQNGKVGNPHISHFTSPKAFDNQNWSITQDNNNVMLFANRRGILTFDGKEWGVIRMPEFPFVLRKEPKSGKIFVGGNEDFGYLVKNEKGVYSYKSLSHGIFQIGEIANIVFTDTHVYFFSNQKIVCFPFDNYYNPQQWQAKKNKDFYGLISLNNKVYVHVQSLGLTNIENLKSEQPAYEKGKNTAYCNLIDDTINFSQSVITFSMPFDKEKCLLGTTENRLYLFDGKKIKNYKIEGQTFVNEGVLFGGIELSKHEFAVSTLTSGCLIIDKATGKTITTINYQTGLPDDEIYSMGVDANKGLWLSHQFGVSRVNFSLPIKTYDTYPGLEGNLISIVDFDSTIFVSSTEGLFYLGEVQKMKEIDTIVQVKREFIKHVPREVIEKSPVKHKKKKRKKKREKKNEQITPKKGWFRKLRDKLKSEKKEEPKPEKTRKKEKTKRKKRETKTKTIVEKKVSYRKIFEKQKKLALQFSGYAFKKIENLQEKCKQIVKFNNRLLVATNTGIYEIIDKEVKPVIKGQYVNCISPSEEANRFFIGTNEGLFSIFFNYGTWEIDENFNEITESVYSIVETSDRKLWLGCENMSYKIELDAENMPISTQPIFFDNEYSEQITVRKIDEIPYFFMSTGIKYCDAQTEEIVQKQSFFSDDFDSYVKYIKSQNEITWINSGKKWDYFTERNDIDSLNTIYFNLFDDIQDIYVDKQKNLWVIDGNNSLYKVLTKEAGKLSNYYFDVFIKGVSNSSGEIFPLKGFEIPYKEFKDNPLLFQVIAPFYVKQESIQYQWFIQGISNKWTNWTNTNLIKIDYLPAGSYSLYIRAKNIFNKKSFRQTFPFVIHPPFWKTIWFIGISICIVILLIILAVKMHSAKLKREKEILESKVEERTREIEKQRKEIMDSIHYAGRIQKAILPYKDLLENEGTKSFILHRPKNIVSGDYYWYSRIEDRLIFAVADCTGHGVPGAFLSMMGISGLNEIVNQHKVLQADEILNYLREYIITSLRQTGKRGEPQDGMDIAVCIVDLKTYEMQYAGANNPCYIVRENELFQLKPDKMPASIYGKKTSVPFTKNEIQLEPGDTVYTFSDGYIDQFGGPKGRKYLGKKFRKTLLNAQKYSIDEQKNFLEEEFDSWRGTNPQIDDVLILGMKF